MRRRLFGAVLALLLACGVLATPAASAVSPPAPRGGHTFQAFFNNHTNHSLTLKAAHLDKGCWNIRPPQKIPPGQQAATWILVSCADGATNGYVTYTIDGTGGQGYAYMPFFVPPPGGDPLGGTQAGGLFKLDRVYHPRGPDANYDLRCLSPAC
ncbi:hypothetical protein [Streptomyces atriruber]|uniref:hypothetical protein n=1 Tax=Streptomyces atriruber TaxID=545121 RepID=UPI0012FF192F|nr:hypothetical protein [Streptomyces atriruber]